MLLRMEALPSRPGDRRLALKIDFEPMAISTSSCTVGLRFTPLVGVRGLRPLLLILAATAALAVANGAPATSTSSGSSPSPFTSSRSSLLPGSSSLLWFACCRSLGPPLECGLRWVVGEGGGGGARLMGLRVAAALPLGGGGARVVLGVVGWSPPACCLLEEGVPPTRGALPGRQGGWD